MREELRVTGKGQWIGGVTPSFREGWGLRMGVGLLKGDETLERDLEEQSREAGEASERCLGRL